MKTHVGFKYEWTKQGWRVHFPTGFKTFIKDLNESQENDLKNRLEELSKK